MSSKIFPGDLMVFLRYLPVHLLTYCLAGSSCGHIINTIQKQREPGRRTRDSHMQQCPAPSEHALKPEPIWANASRPGSRAPVPALMAVTFHPSHDCVRLEDEQS
jgi:hypothetical protein